MGWRKGKNFYRRSKVRIGKRTMSPGQLAQEGRRFESKVEQVLYRMQQQGRIVRFTYHQPHSQEDREGKDFTVVKVVNGQPIEQSFGISISQHRVHQSQEKHPNVPQLHLPLRMKDDQIATAILTLFHNESPAPTPPIAPQ